MPFDRELMKLLAAELAAQGVFIGTSSWKYEGWFGQLYSRDRYVYRGKFAQTRFERNCLTEYAEVFKTVCVDAAYYKFPELKYLESLTGQVPEDFQFAFKVTDEITIKRFKNLPRHGVKAGMANPNFLKVELFSDAFLNPCESFKKNIGILIFEFSRFYTTDYGHGRDFVADLDSFLGNLPKGWPYGVEMRNPTWLQPDYFHCLSKHGVTHVFNSWDAMPSVNEQLALLGSITNPDLCAARFLLKPGRKYEQAVEAFRPYTEVKDPYPEARMAGRQLIAQRRLAGSRGKTFILVNNRLEGNALETIEAMLAD